jgi:hypothetical protein
MTNVIRISDVAMNVAYELGVVIDDYGRTDTELEELEIEMNRLASNRIVLLMKKYALETNLKSHISNGEFVASEYILKSNGDKFFLIKK